jgi:hypothetical protein
MKILESIIHTNIDNYIWKNKRQQILSMNKFSIVSKIEKKILDHTFQLKNNIIEYMQLK